MRAQADESHPDLRAALEHLLAAGGKRVRPTLGLLVGNMLGAPLEKLVTLGAAVELLHTATLVHDDLIDGALLRRGMAGGRMSEIGTIEHVGRKTGIDIDGQGSIINSGTITGTGGNAIYLENDSPVSDNQQFVVLQTGSVVTGDIVDNPAYRSPAPPAPPTPASSRPCPQCRTAR